MSRQYQEKQENSPAAVGGSPGALPAEAERLLELLLHLSTTSRTLRRKLAGLAARIDLTEHELLTVWRCVAAGRVQSELAATLGISPAQMSGLVERLRARGLVELERRTQDRRRHVWRTSPGGHAGLAEAVPHLHELARDLARGLSAEEQQTLLVLCQRLAGAGRPAATGPAAAAVAKAFLPHPSPSAA